jgi:hypothetical protein
MDIESAIEQSLLALVEFARALPLPLSPKRAQERRNALKTAALGALASNLPATASVPPVDLLLPDARPIRANLQTDGLTLRGVGRRMPSGWGS